MLKAKGSAFEHWSWVMPSQAYDRALTERKGRLGYDRAKLVSITQRLLKITKPKAKRFVQQHFLHNPFLTIHPSRP
jgi:hypothetical protein